MKKNHRNLITDAVSGLKWNGSAHFPVIDDRAAWDGLEEDLKDRLIRRGLEALKQPVPELLLSDYRDFCRTGNRVRFENKYFARRLLLTDLVIAECVQNDGSFLDRILDLLYAMLGEVTWCLPAHNSYIRDTPQLEIPNPLRPVIDLFSAESAAVISLSEYLLKSRLEAVSPDISSFVESELHKRILVPYLTEHFWWMGDGSQPLLNWTPWITQNILLTLLAREPDFLQPEEKERILRQAAASLDDFLDDYGEDGCCSEGAQYYSHAGLCLFGCLDLIEQIAGTPLTVLWENALIRNIASYIEKVYAGNGYYLNYADCSPLAGRRGAREFLFARRTKNSSMADFAAEDYRSSSWDERLLSGEENLYYHLLQIFSHKELMQQMPCQHFPEDAWFESTGMLIARDGHFTLSAKAGCNADSHNHNDVGSVILYAGGQPVLIDLGVGTYTKKTFSPQRYEIWTMQSAYHNLPTFYDGDHPIMQKDGAQYRAEQVRAALGKESCSLEMELAAAYQDPRIRSYHRVAALYKMSHAEIEDTYDGDLPCELSLMTYAKPILEGCTENSKGQGSEGCTTDSKSQSSEDCACENAERSLSERSLSLTASGAAKIRLVEANGKTTAILQINSPGPLHISRETCPINDARLGQAWKHDCSRIRIRFEHQINIQIR